MPNWLWLKRLQVTTVKLVEIIPFNILFSHLSIYLFMAFSTYLLIGCRIARLSLINALIKFRGFSESLKCRYDYTVQTGQQSQNSWSGTVRQYKYSLCRTEMSSWHSAMKMPTTIMTQNANHHNEAMMHFQTTFFHSQRYAALEDFLKG